MLIRAEVGWKGIRVIERDPRLWDVKERIKYGEMVFI